MAAIQKKGHGVIIVSGVPRSGTSMIMQMLEAGGVEICSDRQRPADEDNPRGYYEMERVKELRKPGDKSWVETARGKALKVVSQLLQDLPATCFYQIIFLHRDLSEVMISQNKMLTRRGQPHSGNDRHIRLLFEKHLAHIENWVARQTNCNRLAVCHDEVLRDPAGQAARIREFLGMDLKVEKMAAAVDEKLYRNRRGAC